MHAKYMAVDGKRVSISSVNWSKTSYTKNREAGVVFESNAINVFCTNVFDADWAQVCCSLVSVSLHWHISHRRTT